MTKKDVLKVIALLAIAFVAVAMFSYARVDLGMSLQEINEVLQQWLESASLFAVLIWSQLLVVGLVWGTYQLCLIRRENSRAK